MENIYGTNYYTEEEIEKAMIKNADIVETTEVRIIKSFQNTTFCEIHRGDKESAHDRMKGLRRECYPNKMHYFMYSLYSVKCSN